MARCNMERDVCVQVRANQSCDMLEFTCICIIVNGRLMSSEGVAFDTCDADVLRIDTGPRTLECACIGVQMQIILIVAEERCVQTDLKAQARHTTWMCPRCRTSCISFPHLPRGRSVSKFIVRCIQMSVLYLVEGSRLAILLSLSSIVDHA